MYQLNFAQLAPYTPLLAKGLVNTMLISLAAFVISTVIGVLGAVVRLYGPRLLALTVKAYVEVIRNTPVLVQIYFIFFVLPQVGIRLSPMIAGIVALSVHGGAYVTEIIRAGIAAVPRGQIEAGKALGLSRRTLLIDVSLRPALKAMYPALSNEFMLLLLGSSLCGQVAAYELTAAAGDIDSRTFRSFEIYIALGGIYLALSLILSVLFRGFERTLFRWKA
jgi:polar amino acid transport system permease protein